MATLKRQITDAEKMRVLDQQRRDGILYCFAADHPIDEEGDVEFHHIKPFSESGLSDPSEHWGGVQGSPSPRSPGN